MVVVTVGGDCVVMADGDMAVLLLREVAFVSVGADGFVVGFDGSSCWRWLCWFWWSYCWWSYCWW